MPETSPINRQAQRIAVMNNAGLVLSFQVKYADQTGKDCVSPSSANILNPQKATIDMASAGGITAGAKMTPKIAVMAGGEQDGPEIEFAANDLTAVYTVTGTVGSFNVELI
jgi:hypothetical protein